MREQRNGKTCRIKGCVHDEGVSCLSRVVDVCYASVETEGFDHAGLHARFIPYTRRSLFYIRRNFIMALIQVSVRLKKEEDACSADKHAIGSCKMHNYTPS